MRLLAISDLHVDHAANRAAVEALPEHPEDWLLVAGDLSHDDDRIAWAARRLVERFAGVVWVPGNHELWTVGDGPRGEARYAHVVRILREAGALTPEDPWPVLEVAGERVVVAPLFLLYDLSFRPPEVPRERVAAWAAEAGIRSADERWLHAEPHPDVPAWSAVLAERAEARLAARPPGRLVVLSHYPLREDLVLIGIPRYAPWCGTRRTADWPRRFGIDVAVSGHLHVRTTITRGGTRFEEVSLGYPRHWRRARGLEGYLRPILPGHGRPFWYWR